jgi:hypothetical protein
MGFLSEQMDILVGKMSDDQLAVISSSAWGLPLGHNTSHVDL